MNVLTHSIGCTNRSASAAHARRWTGALTALAALSAPALAVPQLEVRVNNQVVASNDEITLDDTALGQSTPLIVVLRNIGNQDLVFTGNPFVSVGGGFSEYFSVIQPPLETGNKLSPNGSTAFRVDFTPGHVANRLDTRVFVFTNATPTVFQLTLAGRSTGPRMVVKQDNVTIADGGVVIFPDTPVGATSTVDLVIRNEGNADLQLTGNPAATLGGGQAAQFAITQQPATSVAPGDSATLTISFTPAAATLVSTGLFLSHNEQSLFQDGLFGAAVQARGLPAVEVIEADEEQLEDENQNENDNQNENVDEELIEEHEELDGNVIEEQLENENQNDNRNDSDEHDEGFEEETGIVAMGNPCGFGIGFAIPACLFGLCSARSGGRRRVAGR